MWFTVPKITYQQLLERVAEVIRRGGYQNAIRPEELLINVNYEHPTFNAAEFIEGVEHYLEYGEF